MRSHRTSWGSLAFGLIFIGAGVLLLTDGVDLATRLHWVGPIFLIVVAFCLIASAVVDRPRPVLGAPWAAAPAPAGGVAARPDEAVPAPVPEDVEQPDTLSRDSDPDSDTPPARDEAGPPA